MAALAILGKAAETAEPPHAPHRLALEAVGAGAAGYERHRRHQIADLEVLDGGSHGDDLAGNFVAQNLSWRFSVAGGHRDISTANAAAGSLDHQFGRARRGIRYRLDRERMAHFPQYRCFHGVDSFILTFQTEYRWSDFAPAESFLKPEWQVPENP